MEYARHPVGMRVVSVTDVTGKLEIFPIDTFDRCTWSNDNAAYRIRHSNCYDVYVDNEEAKRFVTEINKQLA